jgi:hypothetical protein
VSSVRPRRHAANSRVAVAQSGQFDLDRDRFTAVQLIQIAYAIAQILKRSVLRPQERAGTFLERDRHAASPRIPSSD